MNKQTILLTGATGYIGKRLLPLLLKDGHRVICAVRDARRFSYDNTYGTPEVIEIDFLKPLPKNLPPSVSEIDTAFFLIHSMSSDSGDFKSQEQTTALTFVELLSHTKAKQIIYLGGIVNATSLSAHLESRKQVGEILQASAIPTTILRAGIIVGSGSASFEIMRDLVEKLPVMVAPKWLNTRSQPIGIRDVLQFLTGVIGRNDCLNQTFDIASETPLSYREMLLQFAEVRGLKRYILTVPVMTPRLSSYWLYFVTSTSYPLAVNLVNSMNVDVTTNDHRLSKLLNIRPAPYKISVERAFSRINQQSVLSSWKDALVSSEMDTNFINRVEVPELGCFRDQQQVVFPKSKRKDVIENIWRLGGDNGYYYGNVLWRIRGYLDKLVGGVGLRRGRTHPSQINPGDALDFWRVLVADKEQGRLLLYAEMKLPGEAWLEFCIIESDDKCTLVQTATFRPLGVGGRLYWYAVSFLHLFVFSGMARGIVKGKT
ncbi:MAG: SDR family oxidoreductase [Cryomorphaceae bacterium]|nr:SDR family oxidoreductase [Cryomorphaceae bacterium]